LNLFRLLPETKYVGTLKDGYILKVPSLQAPWIQHASHVVTETWDTCYLAQVPCIPMWSDLTRLVAGLGWRALFPFSLLLVQSSLTYQNNLN
jgi:hypothetical protein